MTEQHTEFPKRQGNGCWVSEREYWEDPVASMTPIASVLYEKRDAILKKLAVLDGQISDARTQQAALWRQLSDCQAAGRVLGVELIVPASIATRNLSERLTIKNILLRRLALFPKGFRIRGQREEIEREYGRPVHPKTIGVALRRLRLEGRVNRIRHLWVPVKQNGNEPVSSLMQTATGQQPHQTAEKPSGGAQ